MIRIDRKRKQVSIFDATADKWKLLSGDYKMAVGTASDAANLKGSLDLRSSKRFHARPRRRKMVNAEVSIFMPSKFLVLSR